MAGTETNIDSDVATNPKITSSLRVAMAVAVVVVFGGGLLLFVPDRVTRWIWPIGPFNARFLGAVYWAEMVGGLVLVVVARHLPARVVLPVALVFTGVVTVASIISVGDFDFDRRGPWLWFLAYGAFTALLPFYLPRLLRGPQPPATSPGWRRLFHAEGLILCGYGLGLLIAPEPLTGFWPWPIDAFHGRIYSAIFLTFGVGAFLLARRSAPIELHALGLSRLVLGVLAIAGVALADASAGTVDWGSAGTLIWITAFAVIAAVGGLMAGRTLRPLGRGQQE